MQGASHSTEAKWQTGVLNLLTTKEPWRPDVLALQEAGAVPASATFVSHVPRPGPPGGAAAVVDLYTYGGTVSRPAYSIVFHNWDVAGHRVNLALVTGGVVAAADVELAWGAGPIWRPALGLRMAGGARVFSIHAISPGGVDAIGLLAAAAHTAPWYVAGDFNREPNTVAVPAGGNVCPPSGATYPVAPRPVSEYDYCVRGDGGAAVVGTGVGLVMSDHYPVAYRF